MNSQQFTATEEYPDLENHNSHMAHSLTEDIYRKMRKVETSSGVTIDEVIQIGVDNPGDPYNMTIGCLAGDDESYEVFADFFDLVVEARHNGYKKTDQHSTSFDFKEDKSVFEKSSSTGPCRVRGNRNLKGLCLPSHCTRAERRKVENIAKEACLKLTGEYKGKFYEAKNLPDIQCPEITNNLGTGAPSTNQFPLSMSRDWPDARGVFINEQKNFAVKVNVKDHLQVIAVHSEGNLNEAFDRWCRGMKLLEENLEEGGNGFMKTEHLGYITSCPGDLGTGLKISVQVDVPKMHRHPRFEEVLRRLRLHKRSNSGEKQKSLFEIFNVDRLGITELEIVHSFSESIRFLLKCEEKLNRNDKIETDINRLKNK